MLTSARFLLSMMLLVVALSATLSPQAAQANITQAAIDRVTANMDPDAVYNTMVMAGNNVADAYRGMTFGQATNACINNPPPGSTITAAEWQDKYSGRFSYCMRELLIGATNALMAAVTDYMRPAMAAMILFAMVFIGLKAIAGMLRDPRAESAMFLGKVILVIAVYENVDVIADVTFGTADMIFSMVGASAQATFGASTAGPGCAIVPTGGPVSDWLLVFDHLDCLIESLIGAGADIQLITGLGAILAASIWTGTTGIQLFFMTLSLLIGLLTFLLRVTFMLVMSYGAIGLTLLMIPLMVLGVFFRLTEPYFFNRIIGYIVSNIVQGGVMIAFLFFAVTVLDHLVFSGSPNVQYSYETNPADPFTPQVQLSYGAVGGAPAGFTPYDPVIMPIWVPLGLDPSATLGNQVAQMAANFSAPTKLFEVDLPSDPKFYSSLTKQCGKAGYSKEVDDILDKVNTYGTQVLDELEENFTEWQKAKDAIGNLGKWGRIKANLKICVAGWMGRFGMKGTLNEMVNNQLDDYMPKVQRLQLVNNMPVNPNVQDTAAVHEYNMGKLKVAIIALVILCGTFFVYTNNIPAMARSITGRMGNALTLPDPKVAGQSVLKRVQTSLASAESTWEDAVNKKHPSIKDRLGIDAAKDLVSGRRN